MSLPKPALHLIFTASCARFPPASRSCSARDSRKAAADRLLPVRIMPAVKPVRVTRTDGQALYSYKLRFDFPTDAGILNYLRGREFEVTDIDFVKKYFG